MATSIWRRLQMATRAAINTFRESAVTVDFADPDDYTDVQARKMRYAIYWSMYENTSYRNIHAWAQAYRTQYGLYKFIRNIFNPSYRLGEFWVSHLMAGALDPTTQAGALPVVTENERLRVPIARLWRDSNWQFNKDIWTLQGTILGDAVLRVNDDTEKGRVYLEVIHPGDLTDVTFDSRGNVKAYRMDQTRTHPEGSGEEVTYTELATNEMGLIHYQTLLNNNPYPWNGEASEWDETYGFIPMVICQHHNVGLNWGWSEIHPVRSKMHEADDLASLIDDQIRKMVQAPGLFSGVTPPTDAPQVGGAKATASKPQPGREETPALYAKDAAAKWTPLVMPIDLPGVTGQLDKVLGEIENEYPELHYDRLQQSGQLSGAALRTARQPCEQKVRQRRANYDDALKRAQMMAISIGGMRKYDGYQGFTLDSYQAGDLEHTIADRPVFETSQLDRLEEDTAFWMAAAAATNAGASLEGYLRLQNWPEEKIQQVLYSGIPEQ